MLELSTKPKPFSLHAMFTLVYTRLHVVTDLDQYFLLQLMAI